MERLIKFLKENKTDYDVGIIKDVCPGCGRRAYEGVSVEKINEIKNCCN